MILKNLTAKPKTNPSEIIGIRDGIYAPDLLIAAIGYLDIFTWLEKNPADLNTIADHFNIALRPADVMLTYFRALGLIDYLNDKFLITELAKEHLCKDSEFSLIPYFSTQLERPIVEKMMNVLKTGNPANWGGNKDETDWEKAMKNDNFADRFTSGMDSRGAFFAPALAESFDFSRYKSLLDIGGASGIYAACIKAKHPEIKAALLEKPPVDKIAGDGLSKRGLENQIEIYGADMFRDPIPAGYDIHLYSHVFHDWDLEQNRILVQKSFQSLNRGGLIMIHDANINREKNGPESVAEYSVLLMFATSGKCYSVLEMEELLLSEGFRNIKYQETVGNRSIITGQKN